jgi:chromate transport protein ChrA
LPGASKILAAHFKRPWARGGIVGVADPVGSVVLFKFIMQIVAVVVGVICILLGYRLFKQSTEKVGEVQVEAGNKVKLTLRDVAPGVIFALVGLGALVYALHEHPTYTWRTKESSGRAECRDVIGGGGQGIE